MKKLLKRRMTGPLLEFATRKELWNELQKRFKAALFIAESVNRNGTPDRVFAANCSRPACLGMLRDALINCEEEIRIEARRNMVRSEESE